MNGIYKATNGGKLNPLDKCYIKIPGAGASTGSGRARGTGTIVLNNLPDLSDSKSAVYNQEAIMGRSQPMYTYSHSSDRTISMQLHFFVVEQADLAKNLDYLRMLESAVYPRRPEGAYTPYLPPPVCMIRCGDLLSEGELCVLLQSYSVTFNSQVVWDEESYLPYRFDVDTSWLVTYSSTDMPWQDTIVTSGR